MVERIGLGDVARGAPDHDGELALVVELVRDPRLYDGRAGGREALVRAHEDRREFRDLVTHLAYVLDVVLADAEDPRGASDRRQRLDFGERVIGGGAVGQRAHGLEPRRRERGGEIGRDGARVDHPVPGHDAERRGAGAAIAHQLHDGSASTRFRSTPIGAISISISWPGRSHAGGSLSTAEPPGLPVAIMSPGSSQVKVEMWLITNGMSKIIMSVMPSWRTSPSTRVTIGTADRSAISSAVTIHGPIAPER